MNTYQEKCDSSKITKTQQKLININIDWCELEESMGENVALEVACQQNGVSSSQWFYDKLFEGNNGDVVNRECEKYWSKK